MWLLDANMDVHLSPILAEFGISNATSASFGWKELSNGNLVKAAVSRAFTCLLTRDTSFSESAARALKLFPEFAIVVVTLPQRPGPVYRELFRLAWAASPIKPIPGRLVRWP